MSNIETGTVVAESDPGKIITFPQGLPGFESYTRFSLFHAEGRDDSPHWLESVDSPKVSFTVVDPSAYGLNYVLDLDDDERALLQWAEPDQILVLLMLARTETDEAGQAGIHANIAGPILINSDKCIGLQKVLARSHVEVSIVQD